MSRGIWLYDRDASGMVTSASILIEPCNNEPDLEAKRERRAVAYEPWEHGLASDWFDDGATLLCRPCAKTRRAEDARLARLKRLPPWARAYLESHGIEDWPPPARHAAGGAGGCGRMSGSPITFGSLFSGCGGLDLGLEQAGLQCVFQVEIDPHARAILELHWPDTPRYDDVRGFPPGDTNPPWHCDILVGGDPCQENSRARVYDGTRAPSLGAEFIRVAALLRPRVVLRENPTHSRADAPWPWQRFRDELEALGYVVLPFRLRSCCFGAEHRRDRLFLLAVTPDADREPVRLSGCGEAAGASGALQTGAWERERVRSDAGPMVRGARGRADARDGRADARIPGRLDRLRCLGNAVDVRPARWIGEQLIATWEAVS